MLHVPLPAELGNQIRTLVVSKINGSNRDVHHPYRANKGNCNLMGAHASICPAIYLQPLS